MSEEWKVVPGYYPGFLEIVGASFKVSIVTTASDLSFEDFVNRTNDAHIMAAAKDMLLALESARILWGDYLPPGNSNAMKAMRLVDAAIAKAKQL